MRARLPTERDGCLARAYENYGYLRNAIPDGSAEYPVSSLVMAWLGEREEDIY